MDGRSKQDACGQREIPVSKRMSVPSRHWGKGLLESAMP